VLSFNSEKVSRVIKEVALQNPNMMVEHKDVLYFGTQNNEKGPFVVNCLGDGYCSELKFEYEEELSIMEFSFLKPNLAFLVYNHNSEVEAGIYFIDLAIQDLKKDSVISLKGDMV
jgi:hypothetical protein